MVLQVIQIFIFILQLTSKQFLSRVAIESNKPDSEQSPSPLGSESESYCIIEPLLYTGQLGYMAYHTNLKLRPVDLTVPHTGLKGTYAYYI